MNNDLMINKPIQYFDSLHSELDNMLSDLFHLNSTSLSKSNEMINFRPAVEMKESKKDYIVKVQLPGVNRDDIDIELNSDYITISAESRQENSENLEESGTYRSEFRYGKFVRTLSFSNPINTEETNAKYKDGVLKIILPKMNVKEIQSKKLKIKEA